MGASADNRLSQQQLTKIAQRLGYAYPSDEVLGDIEAEIESEAASEGMSFEMAASILAPRR